MPIDLEEIIKKNNNFRKIIEINKFATWFNPHCATVIDHDRSSYRASLAVYEPVYRKVKEQLVIKEVYRDLMMSNVLYKSKEIEEKLIEGNINFLDYSNLPVRRIEFSPSENPDDHVRTFDIVKRRIIISNLTDNYQIYHVAVYLGQGKICHVYDGSVEISNLVGLNENKGLDYDAAIKKFLLSKANSWARIDDWEKFLCKTTDNVICYHPVTLSKKPKMIIQHLKKSLERKYCKGQYSLLHKNCEHYANLIVHGVNYSEQVDRIGWIFSDKEKGILSENLKNNKEGKRIDELIFYSNLQSGEILTDKENKIFNDLENYFSNFSE